MEGRSVPRSARRWCGVGLLAVGALAMFLPRIPAQELARSVRNLKSSDAAVRRQAAEELAWSGERARFVVPELSDCLTDDDPFVRAHAALALWSIERRAEAVVPVLAELLDTARPGLRPLAAYFLGQIGPDAAAALPALKRTLAASDGLEALQVADAIVRIAPTDGAGLNVLVGGLRHPDVELRFFAACALGESAAQNADWLVPALETALADPEEKVRIGAAMALQAIHLHERGTPARHQAVDHRVDNVPEALASLEPEPATVPAPAERDDSRGAQPAPAPPAWRPTRTAPAVDVPAQVASVERLTDPADPLGPFDPFDPFDTFDPEVAAEALGAGEAADLGDGLVEPELGEPGPPPTLVANRQPETPALRPPAPDAPGPAPEPSPAPETASAPTGWAEGERPLRAVRLDIRPKRAYEDEERTVLAEMQFPDNLYELRFGDVPAAFWAAGMSRSWGTTPFFWDAPAMSHRPLYFEEAYLERYGYHFGIAQPFVSAGYFFGRVPALPYLKTVDHPHEARYTLGQYRPGSPVPFRHECVPIRADAALIQALTVMVFTFAL